MQQQIFSKSEVLQIFCLLLHFAANWGPNCTTHLLCFHCKDQYKNATMKRFATMFFSFLKYAVGLWYESTALEMPRA